MQFQALKWDIRDCDESVVVLIELELRDGAIEFSPNGELADHRVLGLYAMVAEELTRVRPRLLPADIGISNIETRWEKIETAPESPEPARYHALHTIEIDMLDRRDIWPSACTRAALKKGLEDHNTLDRQLDEALIRAERRLQNFSFYDLMP